MMNALPPATTCARGWLSAAEYLVKSGDEAYNLIVDIDEPLRHEQLDVEIITSLDQFLRSHRANPVVTVANTIFPNDLSRRYTGTQLRDEYLRGHDKFKKSWGQYFERLVRWPADGSDQLHNLINRLRKQVTAKSTFHNIYEVALFNPPIDAHRNRNRQCLSFLSFKLHPQRGLLLTAVYRNHYYITRALGNFIGLANLMRYVATEAGTTVGSLTCVSTHAEIDSASFSKKSLGKNHSGAETPDSVLPWTIRQARALVSQLIEHRDGGLTSRLAVATP